MRNYGMTWMVGAGDALTRLTPTARQRLSAREQRLNASSTYPNTRMPANITVISLAVNQVTCDLELLPSCNIFHNNLQLDTDLVNGIIRYVNEPPSRWHHYCWQKPIMLVVSQLLIYTSCMSSHTIQSNSSFIRS